jgi:hypothetical protein
MQTDCPASGNDLPPGPSYTFMDYMGISGNDEMLALPPTLAISVCARYDCSLYPAL